MVGHTFDGTAMGYHVYKSFRVALFRADNAPLLFPLIFYLSRLITLPLQTLYLRHSCLVTEKGPRSQAFARSLQNSFATRKHPCHCDHLLVVSLISRLFTPHESSNRRTYHCPSWQVGLCALSLNAFGRFEDIRICALVRLEPLVSTAIGQVPGIDGIQRHDREDARSYGVSAFQSEPYSKEVSKRTDCVFPRRPL